MSRIKSIAAFGAALATLAFAAPAQAHPTGGGASVGANAQATAYVNVRTGPGTNYRIVDTLSPGERVTVVGRSGGWCDVEKSGPDGWVSCRYLSQAGAGRPSRGDRGDADVSVRFSIPGFSFSIGEGGFVRPGRPTPAGEVCFYEHVGYGGDSFCMSPGESRNSLGSAWNDTISSIRVRGNAEAQVCEHFDFNGRCVIVDRNISDLRPEGNDQISSIRVR